MARSTHAILAWPDVDDFKRRVVVFLPLEIGGNQLDPIADVIAPTGDAV